MNRYRLITSLLIALGFFLSPLLIHAEEDALKAPEDVAAPPEDAEKLHNGLALRVLKEGNGTKHPTKKSKVTVHYSGWTTNGTLFDRSVKREERMKLPLQITIQGWVVGEKRRFWIPAHLAYGDNPGGSTGRNACLRCRTF